MFSEIQDMQRHHFILLLPAILIYGKTALSTPGLRVSTSEIKPFILQRIKAYSRKFSIPYRFLHGLTIPCNRYGRARDFEVSDFAREEVLSYVNRHRELGISPDEIHEINSIDRFLNFISLALTINYRKFKIFFESSGFAVSDRNLWVFSTIGYLFGFNTSLEIVNYYSQINSPSFLRYMLKNEALINKYLCDSDTLWKCFTGSNRPSAAREKRVKLLEFFSSIHYCKEG